MFNNAIFRSQQERGRLLFVLLIWLCLTACESTKSHNHTYPVKFYPTGHHNLDCTDDEGTKIAELALKESFPEYYSRFKEIGFNHWAPIYGKYKGKTQSRYTYKVALVYRASESPPQAGSQKIESIEVSLSKSCEVLGVDYFKGRQNISI